MACVHNLFRLLEGGTCSRDLRQGLRRGRRAAGGPSQTAGWPRAPRRPHSVRAAATRESGAGTFLSCALPGILRAPATLLAAQYRQPGEPRLATPSPPGLRAREAAGCPFFLDSSRSRSRARKRPSLPALGLETPLALHLRAGTLPVPVGQPQWPPAPASPPCPAQPAAPPAAAPPPGTAASSTYSGGPPAAPRCAGGRVRGGIGRRRRTGRPARRPRPEPEARARLPGRTPTRPQVSGSRPRASLHSGPPTRTLRFPCQAWCGEPRRPRGPRANPASRAARSSCCALGP